MSRAPGRHASPPGRHLRSARTFLDAASVAARPTLRAIAALPGNQIPPRQVARKLMWINLADCHYRYHFANERSWRSSDEKGFHEDTALIGGTSSAADRTARGIPGHEQVDANRITARNGRLSCRDTLFDSSS